MNGGHVLALSGGVGGAKLCAGLAAVLPPERLTIVVNTGDDFEHLGLTICPDIDSVLYALAGINDEVRGWGVAGETWEMMGALARLGGPTWFNLGDRDLATHLLRSEALRGGESMSAVTDDLAQRLGIAHRVAPMSDDPVRTQVRTDSGWSEFQRWFVGEQCRPVVHEVRFAGAETAKSAPAFAAALARDDLAAVVICPSNPLLSVDPILAVPRLRQTLNALSAPVIAVSPLVGGKAIKGPLAKMLAERGLGSDNAAIAAHYGALVDHWLIDTVDDADAEALRTSGRAVTVTPTVMRSAEDCAALARAVLAVAGI